eukprot:919535-Pleurochrysis_carterae.AAC.1
MVSPDAKTHVEPLPKGPKSNAPAQHGNNQPCTASPCVPPGVETHKTQPLKVLSWHAAVNGRDTPIAAQAEWSHRWAKV